MSTDVEHVLADFTQKLMHAGLRLHPNVLAMSAMSANVCRLSVLSAPIELFLKFSVNFKLHARNELKLACSQVSTPDYSLPEIKSVETCTIKAIQIRSQL